MALLALSPYALGAVIDGLAWVEGTVANIKGEIVFLKSASGQQFKLRRAWVEKKHKNFQPGHFMEVEVNFDEYLKLNAQ
jgi:hypothetical protein